MFRCFMVTFVDNVAADNVISASEGRVAIDTQADVVPAGEQCARSFRLNHRRFRWAGLNSRG